MSNKLVNNKLVSNKLVSYKHISLPLHDYGELVDWTLRGCYITHICIINVLIFGLL